MKAKLLISSLLLGTAILAIAKGDPVLMTINGKDIKLSEFEYLYHKNNQQQVEKETLEQYVDRFVLYKQKVADAEAAGIDTTTAFVTEFEGYQKDLATPYMTEDTSYHWKFVEEAYNRYKQEINVDHIMLPVGTPEVTEANMIRMDSIRSLALAGEDWESLAERFSSDGSKVRNHGHYNFISSCMFPYDFENVVYSTPVGEISKPFKTQFGVHMIRVNEKRNRDDVHARHIIKVFPKNATDGQKAECKAKIDSIYNLLKAGADFEEMARAESQDASAKRGGSLGWFGRGRMVPQFEQVVFALRDGEISQPFATEFGYHIAKRDAHGCAPLSEIRGAIETAISRDERSKLIRQNRLNDLKANCNYRINPELAGYFSRALQPGVRVDSAFVAQYIKGSTMPMFSYGKKYSVPLSELATQIKTKAPVIESMSMEYLMNGVDNVAEKYLTDYHARELVKSNPEYRNLLNEYRDGMLLFEISNRRVWKAANKDTVGLERQFAENRSKYVWDEPHFKGIILSAKNDSVLNLVKADIQNMAAETLTTELHEKYGSDIRMERMVVKQGENNLADYLAFHVGDKPERKGYEEFMILEGGVISQPQEMADVRGAVTSDYQDVLEQLWREELAAKYPAKINKKVLKKVK